MTDVIHFSASVAQVRTMADGGIRITLDLAETAIETAAAIMQVRQGGGVLEIAAVPVIPPPVILEEKHNDRPRKHHSPYIESKAEA